MFTLNGIGIYFMSNQFTNMLFNSNIINKQCYTFLTDKIITSPEVYIKCEYQIICNNHNIPLIDLYKTNSTIIEDILFNIHNLYKHKYIAGLFFISLIENINYDNIYDYIDNIKEHFINTYRYTIHNDMLYSLIDIKKDIIIILCNNKINIYNTDYNQNNLY